MNKMVKAVMTYIASQNKTGASYDKTIDACANGEPWRVVDAWERIEANGWLANLPRPYDPPGKCRWFLTGTAHVTLRRENEKESE